MSTQDGYGIEFSVLPEDSQQHFRLLELPPDLLAVITSQDAPVLKFKASRGPLDQPSSSDAVLCTPNKTYNMRQVSTSNTVYVVQPSESPSGDDEATRPSLQAIAQSHTTLELLPATNMSAASYIRAVLPTFASTGHVDAKDPVSKAHLFADIPLSDSQCESNWRELSCFESPERDRCFVPSASIKLMVWRAVLLEAAAKHIDLTVPMAVSDQAALTSLDEDWPEELSKAVLRTWSDQSNEVEGLKLDQTNCTRGLGRILLKDSASGNQTGASLSTFLSTWAEVLPEPWRDNAKLNVLEGCYKLDSGGERILFVESSTVSESAATSGPAAESKSSLGAKRKWHEKFRASKKTA